MYTLSRRELITEASSLGLALLAASCSPAASPKAAKESPGSAVGPQAPAKSGDSEAGPVSAEKASDATVARYMAVVEGNDPSEITTRAIEAIGGMRRFVQPGYDVIVKPNICNAYHGPEYASTTNPIVVGTLVKMALDAGAKRVRVLDYPFGGSAERAYETSGIAKAVRDAGGDLEVMNFAKFVEVDIPDGVDLKSWKAYKPVLDADLVINVPIAKHHNSAGLTLAAKNLLGVIDNRGQIHWNLHQRIADVASLFRPQLTVVDAVRMLMDHGPTGGNLADVKEANTVIASHDFVAAEAYAATLFEIKPEDIGYIALGAEMELGSMDLGGLDIVELK